MGAGDDPLGDGLFQLYRSTGLTDVIDDMCLAVQQYHVVVRSALDEPVFGADGAAIAALVTSDREGAVFGAELDNGDIQFELLKQEVQQVIHNDLQVEGAVYDLGCLQPDEKRLAALVQGGSDGAEDVVDRLHARSHVG